MIHFCTIGFTRSGAVRRLSAALAVFLLMGWWAPFVDTAASAATQLADPAGILQGESKGRAYQTWPHEKSDLEPDPAIRFGRLASGFRYVLMENNRPADRVSVHLYIGAGSLNETDAQQGIAHFLEHMLFNGSTHFPPGELVRYFQSIGMQFGNDANAHTGFDETVYDIILPTGDEESLKKGLLVVRDYAMGALLLEEEVKRESGVILSEMRSRDSVSYRTFKASLAFELGDHLISRRLPIGKAEIIKNADRALLKQFYDAWYRPDNMVLVLVGNFSTPMAERLIRTQFSDFAPRASAPAAPVLGTINHTGLKIFHHHEPEAGGTTVSLEVIRPLVTVPDSLALQRRELVAEMGDQIVQNRLDDRLKAPESPFTSAAVGSGSYLNRIRYAEISADSAADRWEQTLAVLEQTLRQARLHGFSETELARVKKDTLKMLENKVREAATRNSTALARGIVRDLSDDRVILSPLQEKEALAPMIHDITLAEVHQAFKENWPDDHRLVLVSGDADLKTISQKAPETLIRDAFLASASTVVHRPEVEAVGAFPYLPMPEDTGSIVSREVVDDLGITRIRFANGIRVNLKHTDYKTNEVLANLIFGQGQSAEPGGLPGLSLLAEATMDESGLGQMGSNELAQALAGKSTYVDFRITETHFNLFGETVSGEVELLFQLIYANLTDPGFREDALALARERLRREYGAFSRSIEGMMRIEGLRFLAGGDNRFGMPSLEQIQAVQLDDIRGWIAPRLNRAPLELSVVGDFDENQVIELARRYLAALPPRDQHVEEPVSDLPRLPSGTVKRIDVDTQIPKAMVVAAWQTEDFWDINRTRRLSVLADVFSERLRQRIREKLGASYSPYAFNRASRAYAGYGVFQAYINVAPEQTDTVLAEVNAIAGDLARNGITADELARAVDPILTSIKELRQTNGYWLNSVMTGSERHPQQLEWARSFQSDYAAVTTGELALLAATYLTDERSAAIIIQPMQKSGS
ncbi:peptidase M16 [Desulfosarcina alkanivorans]|uniref:Peptidase M16 n=1 Tax=Desulfosarcina alkanivorans TaxID=571177 RepID=A0A5K7YV87_9BACT|nr:M16 family metallopeptidase [Desulfosarcina alkanivorans]BBO71923.1 peptidase M16 [Desulfosarcina alkanivorans]